MNNPNKGMTGMKRIARRGALALPALLASGAAFAQAEAPKIDAGNTAWMLTATALVLMMTIPGLALFYAGMVRKKNVLATMMQSFFICALVAITWMVVGYSIAFGNGGPYFGDFSKVMFQGINWDGPFVLGAGLGGESEVATTIPETVFAMFQMTFAIITPALITGAVADRMKFSALCVFTVLWSALIYAPVAHAVWHPAGIIWAWGALDFAGGTVVHINAGVAGLVAAMVLGKRIGYGSENMSPYSLALAVIGATAAGTITWTFAEWAAKGKPSVLGAISGAVAGLVAITPASGWVFPGAALIIGGVAGVICFWGATALKRAMGYDDSLDAFGVHGIGGIVGALLTGVFAYGLLYKVGDAEGAVAYSGILYGNSGMLWIQAKSVLATIAFSGIGTFIILKVIDVIIGLRVTEEEEREGLDVALHGERLG